MCTCGQSSDVHKTSIVRSSVKTFRPSVRAAGYNNIIIAYRYDVAFNTSWVMFIIYRVVRFKWTAAGTTRGVSANTMREQRTVRRTLYSPLARARIIVNTQRVEIPKS